MNYIITKAINNVRNFLKKAVRTTALIYDNEKEDFTSYEPNEVDPEAIADAIETIHINDECYIEIFENNNVFTYRIMVLDCDDYEGNCYYSWVPKNTHSVGFYDTKENAVKHAYDDIPEYTDKNLWTDTYKNLELKNGIIEFFTDDDQDMFTVTYSDKMMIDVGFIEEEKTYYITVVSSDDEQGWAAPIEVIETKMKSELFDIVQRVILKYR